MTKEKYIPSWTEFNWTPWGFGKDHEDKPSKEEMFLNNFDGKWNQVSTHAIEDFLQHNEVFKNGFRNTSCHMDSYMTIVDYHALETALDILIEEYNPSPKEWNNIVEAWMSNPNNQPPARIVALTIKRKFVEGK
jgi:hypothetical protein